MSARLRATHARFTDPETLKLFLQQLQTQRMESGLACPHCSSPSVIGHGKYRDRQRYKCKECNRTFNDLTNTPMHRTHYPTKFIKFMECMIKGYSLYRSALIVGVTLVTVFYWRHKVLKALQQAEIQLEIDQFSPEEITPPWTSRYITFRDGNPIRLPLFKPTEQTEFQEWMQYYSWIAVKYLNRYITWFRSVKTHKHIYLLDSMKGLFSAATSISLDQTYQSIRTVS